MNLQEPSCSSHIVTKGEKSMNTGHITRNRASATSELRYNLFRHKAQPELRCAVPEDQPVPGFVTGELWDFWGTLDGISRLGFSRGTRPRAFYMFHVIEFNENLIMFEYSQLEASCETSRGDQLDRLLSMTDATSFSLH